MEFCRLGTETLPRLPSSHLCHLLPPHTLPDPQFHLQPTSALCPPSEQLSHQDDKDQEEKGPQDEEEDPRQGEDARDLRLVSSLKRTREEGWRRWAQRNPCQHFQELQTMVSQPQTQVR